jgi:hypothetical protein
MFAPSRDQARQFFFDTWKKYGAGEALSALEQIALAVISLHPEYHALLEDTDRNLDRNYTPAASGINPFLHLSLHLAVEEQLSIDQPPGLRAKYEQLRIRSTTPSTQYSNAWARRYGRPSARAPRPMRRLTSLASIKKSARKSPAQKKSRMARAIRLYVQCRAASTSPRAPAGSRNTPRGRRCLLF